MYAKIRLGLIALFLILGAILHVKIGFTPAWYLYLAAFVLLLTYFLFNNVWAAFTLLRKGKLLEAETMLDAIKKPAWLAKSSRAYYYFIRGMIALQRKELDSAKAPLQKALDLGLRSDNDNGLAALNLAHIHFVQNNFAGAEKYLSHIKTLTINDLMLKENVSTLEKALEARTK